MMYKFRNSSQPTEKAQEVGNDLLAIKQANQGLLLPCDVVAAAAPIESSLHYFFEWDDSLAAEQHRLSQARRLITSVVFIREVKKKNKLILVSRAAFTHVRTDKNGYRDTDEVYNTPELKAAYIRQLQTDWKTFKQKHYDVLKDMTKFSEIDDL